MANKIKLAGTTSNNFQIGLQGVTLYSNRATAPYNLSLPTDSGLVGQVIVSDGTGNLDWSNDAFSAGTVTANAQPNITSLGTLTELSVTGNITGANVISSNTLVYNRTYGAFTSNITQTNSSANAENLMTFNNTQFSNSVSIISNSQITIERIGLYNIQFSAQITKSDSGSDFIEIYLKQDGNAVSDTNTRIDLDGNNAKTVGAWNWLVNVATANTYYELGWRSPDTDVQLLAVDNANTISNVAIPSIILTVVPVGA